jgi:hypothetical protein
MRYAGQHHAKNPDRFDSNQQAKEKPPRGGLCSENLSGELQRRFLVTVSNVTLIEMDKLR